MLTVLIDDDRDFIVSRPRIALRSSAEALDGLRRIRDEGQVIDELWLDHDLGGDDRVMPVIDWLAELAFNDDPYPVRRVYVHSMNREGADTMMRSLTHYGYAPVRVPVSEHLIYVEGLRKD